MRIGYLKAEFEAAKRKAKRLCIKSSRRIESTGATLEPIELPNLNRIFARSSSSRRQQRLMTSPAMAASISSLVTPGDWRTPSALAASSRRWSIFGATRENPV